mmetsp:Transcript_25597/g.75525  ORF Transcript_25597/g.75525 Transcript_25597/m.75525 type:complete len:138 (-) Transcript_25597:1704-2117(-)
MIMIRLTTVASAAVAVVFCPVAAAAFSPAECVPAATNLAAAAAAATSSSALPMIFGSGANTGDSLMAVMSRSAARSLGRDKVDLKPASGGGGSGGGGASTSAVVDEVTGEKYFVKKCAVAGGGATMLRAEYLGETNR